MDILACVPATSLENFAGNVNSAGPSGFVRTLLTGWHVTGVSSFLNPDVVLLAAEFSCREPAGQEAAHTSWTWTEAVESSQLRGLVRQEGSEQGPALLPSSAASLDPTSSLTTG